MIRPALYIRLIAEIMARNEAETIDSCKPTPQVVSAVAGVDLDEGGRRGIAARPDGMLGIVDDLAREVRLVLKSVDERVDGSVTFASNGALLAGHDQPSLELGAVVVESVGRGPVSDQLDPLVVPLDVLTDELAVDLVGRDLGACVLGDGLDDLRERDLQ